MADSDSKGSAWFKGYVFRDGLAKHGRNPDVSRVKQRPPPPEPIVTLEMIAAGVRNGRRNGEQAPSEDHDTSR